MRGIAFALVALTFAATTHHPAAAQCYGPECDRYRSGPRPYYNEPPNFRSTQQPQGYQQPQGQTYPSGPQNQPQSYRPAPYEQSRQAQPYGPPQYEQGRQYQPAPQTQPAYYQPGYQAQPRRPVSYSNAPPGMPPRGYDNRSARPDGHEVTTRVTKISRTKKSAVHLHQPGPTGRSVARTAPPNAGPGQVTISVAEYRDLQNQARELQRLRGARSGAPNGNGGSPFPDAPPPGQQPGPGQGF